MLAWGYRVEWSFWTDRCIKIGLDGLAHGSRNARDEQCELATLVLIEYTRERLLLLGAVFLTLLVGGPRHVLEHVGWGVQSSGVQVTELSGRKPGLTFVEGLYEAIDVR